MRECPWGGHLFMEAGRWPTAPDDVGRTVRNVVSHAPLVPGPAPEGTFPHPVGRDIGPRSGSGLRREGEPTLIGPGPRHRTPGVFPYGSAGEGVAVTERAGRPERGDDVVQHVHEEVDAILQARRGQDLLPVEGAQR